MKLEWIDPPRDYRDDCADIAAQLKKNPGQWARVETGVNGYAVHLGENRTMEELADLGIEVRFSQTSGVRGTYGERGDIYARAPKEAE